MPFRKNAYEGSISRRRAPIRPAGAGFARALAGGAPCGQVLRSGGIYLSFVPTVPQVMQTVEALERTSVFGMIETFETLLRTWSIQGRSVRPDHRMVAHSGFLTVARKVEEGGGRALTGRRDRLPWNKTKMSARGGRNGMNRLQGKVAIITGGNAGIRKPSPSCLRMKGRSRRDRPVKRRTRPGRKGSG